MKHNKNNNASSYYALIKNKKTWFRNTWYIAINIDCYKNTFTKIKRIVPNNNSNEWILNLLNYYKIKNFFKTINNQ